MRDATVGLERLYECVAAVDSLDPESGVKGAASILSAKDTRKMAELEPRFQEAMDNDFNTAQAQGIFFDTIKTINRIQNKINGSSAVEDIQFLKNGIAVLKKLAAVMGLLREDAQHFLTNRKAKLIADSNIDEKAIEMLIAERYQCRLDKNWSRSDEIRDELLAQNIELHDGPDGTTWSVKSN
jgi:cysteinyl-tRNA synthetase